MGVPVRFGYSFGLWGRLYGSSCPNEALIRTRFPFAREFLSNSAIHSDSGIDCMGAPVRMRHLFGLWDRLHGSSCPNEALIRTLGSIVWGLLSESRTYSDSIFVCTGVPVRFSYSFGLSLNQIYQKSPNKKPFHLKRFCSFILLSLLCHDSGSISHERLNGGP